MSIIQFIGTNPTDLITELKNSLIPELTAQLSEQFQPKDLSTLHRWRKDGTIPSFGMGNRVFFKRSEIEQIINQNKLS